MLISIVTFLVGLVGAALVSFGAWLLSAPAGYIVAGSLCLIWSWLVARAAASQRQPKVNGEGG
ncbi:hypothetical protein QO259_17140 [Salinicola sp. JS01]|uniref:hypothetical protein n=1 Tax=Salinicola sp. JS01 TaxID=3050071 RepID=UPI00255C12E9|nr:hypothetical protein [Salinicola sp. JS01]WIX32513.1 hypothetical protein QO259_17140 [Salinicola sp. JS01]